MTDELHSPSLYLLLPSLFETFLYTRNSLQAIRFVTVGFLGSYLTNSFAPYIIFAVIAGQQLISAVRIKNIFGSTDYYGIGALFVSLLALTTSMLIVYNEQQKNMEIAFLAALMQAFSVCCSVVVVMMYNLAEQAVFLAPLVFIGFKPLYNSIIDRIYPFYDNFSHQLGFGVDKNGVNYGKSLIEEIREKYGKVNGIMEFIMLFATPIVINLICNWFSSWAWSFLVLYSCILSAISAIFIIVLRKEKGIRTYFARTSEPDSELPLGPDEKRGAKVGFTGKLCVKELFFAAILGLVYFITYFVNRAHHGKVESYVNYALMIPCVYLSALAMLLENDWLFLPLQLFMDPLFGFLHFLIHAMLNFIENGFYSQELLISSEFACLLFVNVVSFERIAVPLFNVVLVVFAALTNFKKLNNSKFGVELVCFLHSFALDLVITVPRDYQMNLLINAYVFIAIFQFSQLFLEEAIGRFQSFLILGTIVIRVAANVLNSMLLRHHAEGQDILLKISGAYGIFSMVLSLVLELVSFFNIEKIVNHCKDVLVFLIFAAVCAPVIVTPLSIVILDVLLFATGFSSIISNSLSIKSSLLQAISVILYKTFFLPENDLKFTVLAYLIRTLCGMFAGSSIAIFFSSNEYLRSLFFASLSGLFLAVPSAVSRLEELNEVEIGEIVVICVVFVLIVAIPSMKHMNQSVFNVLFVTMYIGLVIFSLFTSHWSEGTVLMLFLIILAQIPESFSIVAYILSVVLLILAVNARYAQVVVTYASAVATFSVVSAIFFVRFIMIKNSSLRRLVKKAKISNASAKINTKAFGVDEEEFDVFLTSVETENTDAMNSNRQEAEEVFLSLYPQLYIFIGIAAFTLSIWGFDVFALLFLALSTLCLPACEKEEGTIRQVAGYYGIATNWQYNQTNKQELVTRFAWTLFLLLEGRIVTDSLYFILELILDYEGVKDFAVLLLKDLLLNIPISAAALTGLAYITAQPLGFYRMLQTQQRVKLLTVLSVVGAVFSIFATSKTIKTLLVFAVAGIFWSAPASAGITGKRIVEVESGGA